MTQTELDALNRGDIITHVTGDSYIVLQRRGKRLTAIREIDVSNPNEWELFSRNPRKKERIATQSESSTSGEAGR